MSLLLKPQNPISGGRNSLEINGTFCGIFSKKDLSEGTQKLNQQRKQKYQ
jgi:hypothetical protein